jgi:hypothetical protein
MMCWLGTWSDQDFSQLGVHISLGKHCRIFPKPRHQAPTRMENARYGRKFGKPMCHQKYTYICLEAWNGRSPNEKEQSNQED